MKIFLKLIAILSTGLLLVCGLSFLTDKNRFGQWTIHYSAEKNTELPWLIFNWVNEYPGSKQYEKTAMFTQCKIDGLPYTFSFQFDLGSNLTMLYERNARSVFRKHKGFQNRIASFRSTLQFWNAHKAFKNITLNFGNIKATSANCYVKPGFGEELSYFNTNQVIPLGTIGADLFQEKVLILDYPNERFTVCDSLPLSFNVRLTDIELDNTGRVILPLKYSKKTYKALFDNGSSLFPLLVTDDKISRFSTLPPTDTLEISSWGTTHKVIGQPLKDSFQLGGQNFSEALVYVDYRKEARTASYDAIAGNALFWNRTVIIDFKNKKFGVK